jgi:hypothetical protein
VHRSLRHANVPAQSLLSQAAIDQATDLGIPIDLGGDARPFGAGFDIGWDEYAQRLVYWPLVRK